jgi:ribonucleoside-diphosphate reductase alpha chain
MPEVLRAGMPGETGQTKNVVGRKPEVAGQPIRRRLPDTRSSITHKFDIAGHEGYMIVGLYENGQPGELFITMAKEGSTVGGLMDCIGTLSSLALQYGVPVEALVKKFAHQRFEPSGLTKNPDIRNASSVIDYVFRWMAMQFIPGYRESCQSASSDLPSSMEIKET